MNKHGFPRGNQAEDCQKLQAWWTEEMQKAGLSGTVTVDAQEVFVVQRETERLYEVQLGSDCQRGSTEVTGVPMDLWLDENDIEHTSAHGCATCDPTDSAAATAFVRSVRSRSGGRIPPIAGGSNRTGPDQAAPAQAD